MPPGGRVRIDFGRPVAPQRVQITFRYIVRNRGPVDFVEVFAQRDGEALVPVEEYSTSASDDDTGSRYDRCLTLDLPELSTRYLEIRLFNDGRDMAIFEVDILGSEQDAKRIVAQASAPVSVPVTVRESQPLQRDVVIAETEPRPLRLSLFMPAGVQNPPLVMGIHGGSWRSGSYRASPGFWLINHGFAFACIDYRLSQEAVFPAQIHDVKAAVRWLRAHAGEYGYNLDRIAALGESAGGHLATLLGVSAGMPELEGSVGGNLDQSSAIQAVVDFYGPTDFILRSKDQPEKTEHPSGIVYKLLGEAVGDNAEKAKLASPAYQVTSGDPPLLIFHGDDDDKVLSNQTERLVEAYRQAGLEVTYTEVPGAGHGGDAYETKEIRQAVVAFLKANLNGP